MVVVSFGEYRSRETVAVLEVLLRRAKKGEIAGLALCARPVAGPEEIVFTDLYRHQTGRALMSVMRMSTRLTQMEDEADEPELH